MLLCRYIWGVIIFTEGREGILKITQTGPELPNLTMSGEDEEVLALVAADMHQDPRTWEAVWVKPDVRRERSTLDVSSTDGDVEMENADDLVSMSEESARDSSDVRSGAMAGASEGSPVDHTVRPVLTHRWSGEDETWDSMVAYVRSKIAEQKQKDVKLEMVEVSQEEVYDREAIQRRMSISNFL